MSQEIGTSHIWIPINEQDIKSGQMPTNDSDQAINLHDKFPLPKEAALQEAWDSRIEDATESLNGLITPYTIFNPGAEEATMFWYMGYGADVRSSGSAREAATVAALNPSLQLIAINELEGVPASVKGAGFLKHIRPYANSYMSHVREMEVSRGIVPTMIGGRSRGGRVSTIVASHPDMPMLDQVVTTDTPGAHFYPSKLWFGAQVAIFENMDKYKGPTLVGIDEAEERTLEELTIPVAEPKTALENAKIIVKDIWLTRGLGAIGLAKESEEAMSVQTRAQFTNFHATGNLGMPLEDNNQIMLSLMEQYGSRAAAYIGYTRHFSEGHGPRFARQLAQARKDVSGQS